MTANAAASAPTSRAGTTSAATPQHTVAEEFVLGVDLDGVCADYEAGFRRVAAVELGVPESQLPTQTAWSFLESGWPFDSEQHFLDVHRTAVLGGMFAHLDAIPGVSEALWRLSDGGVRIRVVTHRLVVGQAHAASVSSTVEWLDRYAIPYWDLCFARDKADVGADLYIDDSPGKIEALRSARGANIAMVFDQPYNRHVGGLRAYSWQDVVAEVSRRTGQTF